MQIFVRFLLYCNAQCSATLPRFVTVKKREGEREKGQKREGRKRETNKIRKKGLGYSEKKVRQSDKAGNGNGNGEAEAEGEINDSNNKTE